MINKKKVDVVFNALHGRDGEDGVAQSYFEYLKIPYTHSGVISSYNCMNKIYSKELFIKNKIKTPKFFSINKFNHQNKIVQNTLNKKRFRFPITLLYCVKTAFSLEAIE